MKKESEKVIQALKMMYHLYMDASLSDVYGYQDMIERNYFEYGVAYCCNFRLNLDIYYLRIDSHLVDLIEYEYWSQVKDSLQDRAQLIKKRLERMGEDVHLQDEMKLDVL